MTCLCLTRNRRHWLPQAIRCFLDQTYPHRELLILSDGDDVRDLVPADERIRHIHLEGASNIGEKRNFGCSRARGELIAHWDDDDYSAAGRLADQLGLLGNSGKAVVGYSSMEFRCEFGGNVRRWMYQCAPVPTHGAAAEQASYALGTSLLYRRDWVRIHPFPAKQIAEDGAFVRAAISGAEFAASDAGDLMWASIHDHNTSPRRTSGSAWREL